MADQTPHGHLEDDISVHSFTASAAMVGVCLPVIGRFRISEKLRNPPLPTHHSFI